MKRILSLAEAAAICLLLSTAHLAAQPVPPQPEATPAPELSETADSAQQSSTASTNSASQKEVIDSVFAKVQERLNETDGADAGGLNGDQNNNKGATTDEGNPSSEETTTLAIIGQMLMSLAFVISLGLAIAWVTKRYLLPRNAINNGFVDLIGSYPISQKSRLHVVRVGEEFFLLGESNTSISLIAPIDSPLSTATASASNTGASFKQPPANGIDEDTIASFQERLSEWNQSLDGQNLSQEVRGSLSTLSNLSQRLKRKKETSHGS